MVLGCAEAWCLMDLLVPGCLGKKGEFNTYYADKIKEGLSKNATPTAVALGKARQRQLHDLIHKHLIRRTKVVPSTLEL